MNKEARKILYMDLKSKGFTSEEANAQLKAWDSDVQDLVDEKLESGDSVIKPRHGTTCVGIVAKKSNGKPKAIVEW